MGIEKNTIKTSTTAGDGLPDRLKSKAGSTGYVK